MGGGKGGGSKGGGSKKKKTYTKAQQLAKKRIADKKKAESTGTTGGKTTSTSTISTSAQVAKDNKKYGNTVPSGSFGISQAGRDQAAINRGIAAAKKTGIPSGNNLKSGSFGISSAGKKQAAINRASVKKSSGPKFTEAPKLIAEAPKTINPFNIFQTKEALKEAEAAREGVRPKVDNPGFLDSILNRNSETQKMLNELSANPTDTQVAAAGNISGLGIGAADTGPNYFKIKSPETFGAPSQEAVDKAAGITAGGLNIGGSGFTPDKPSGSTARAIADPTEAGLSIKERAARRDAIFKETGVQTYGGTRDVYGYSKSELDKLRNFSDRSGLSFGSVIGQKGTSYPGQLGVSEEEIALNNAFNYRDDGLVMNSIGQFVTPEQRAIDDADAGPSVGRSLATGFNNIVDRIPVIGKRLPNLKTDYTRAEQNLLTKTTPFKTGARTKTGAVNRSGGGARLPVAPMTPEEILEEAAVGQTVPDYQQATNQTGVDPNRLMQIQQDAYIQAFNPTYNPMFRFFDRRRGARRGAFRKAFRRD